MKKLLSTLCLCLALGSAPILPVMAEEGLPPDHILIIAVQTGQTGAVGNDFVEVYNPTLVAFNVTGWKLQYRSATATGATTWTTKRTIACPLGSAADCTVELPAGGHLIFSTYDLPNIEGEQPMSTGLSDVGGQLRILQPAVGTDPQVVHDLVGYGTAAEAEGALAAPAPLPDETVVRLINETMGVVDTNVNAADFHVLVAGCYGPGGSIDTPIVDLCIVPTIPDDPPPPIEPAPTPTPVPEPTPAPDPAPTPAGPSYKALAITELLPDPAMPQTDGEYEFIELHNPNSEAVNATGYILQTGTNYRYQYALGALTIPAGGYVAVTSAQSHLSLSNSGTAVRLSAPNGAVQDEIASYGDAKVGQSWAKSNSGWSWTVRPTPSAANQSLDSSLPPKSKGVGAVKRADTANSVGSNGLSAGAKADEQPQVQTAVDLLSPWFLAPVGALVASYGAYEYRKDLARFGRKIKSFFSKGKDGGITPRMG